MAKQTNKKKKAQKKKFSFKKKSSSLTYINGTNTDKETSIKHLNLNTFDKLGYNVTVTDGVGTIANTKQEKKLRHCCATVPGTYERVRIHHLTYKMWSFQRFWPFLRYIRYTELKK